jgi:hypothetical protein
MAAGRLEEHLEPAAGREHADEHREQHEDRPQAPAGPVEELRLRAVVGAERRPEVAEQTPGLVAVGDRVREPRVQEDRGREREDDLERPRDEPHRRTPERGPQRR